MTRDEYLRLLMAGEIMPWTQTDPIAPTLPTGYMGSALIQPSYDKKGNLEPFSLDTQKDAYNALQDWANINSDPAILGGLFGEAPNYGETVYTPLPELTAVLNYAKQGDTTVEGMIANEILAGGSVSSAINKIKRLIDPNGDAYDEALAGIVPTYTKTDAGETTQELDEDYLKDIGNQFQQAYMSVPIDPETGKPKYEIDPETGQASFAKTELSELGQWYKDTNTPLPTDTYDPDLIAYAHTLAQEQSAPGRLEEATKRLADLDAMRRRLLSEGPVVNGPIPSRNEGGGGGPVSGREKTPQRGGIADDLERLTQHPLQSIGGFAGNLPGRVSAVPGALDRNIGDPAERAVQAVQGWLGLRDEGGGASAIEQAVRNAAAGATPASPAAAERPVDRAIQAIRDAFDNPQRRGSIEWGPWGQMELSPNPPQGYQAQNEALRQAAAYMGRSAGPAPDAEGPRSLLAARTAGAPGTGIPRSERAQGRSTGPVAPRTPISFAQLQSLLTPGVDEEAARRRRQITLDSLQARGDKERARQDILQAKANQEQRLAMVQLLASQGHTPYNDTMAKRRALAKAGGFGA